MVTDRGMVSVGGVASRFTTTVAWLDPPALDASQVSVRPGVSTVTTVWLPPLVVGVDWASVTCQSTVTSPAYHPLSPVGPLTCGTISGGVTSQASLNVAWATSPAQSSPALPQAAAGSLSDAWIEAAKLSSSGTIV